ncbi:Protein dennd6a [Saguinus oedipus]|uniref:Protein dennd6a n=1 Tax=Saguinus oedipus TaxID=9490 RepID=A0ABQ9U3K8_SAGOE|nr:Protein dennd6a [Saguinus oedipus]
MALRGPVGLGPGSRRRLDEAVAAAEGREAPALVAAGGAPEDDEEDDGRGRGLLRWDGFSAWLHCVCVVGFDLELGQAVEPCVRAPPPRRGGSSKALGSLAGLDPSPLRRSAGLRS